MSRNKKGKKHSNDYVETKNISKVVERKAKRGSKRRISERLGSIRSLQDAEVLEDTDDLLER